MFCPNCGTQNPDASKFCTSCGAALTAGTPKAEASDDQKKIQLRCKACGGSLDIVNGQNILLCPFCGSKELIQESDAVTIQRIKSNITKNLVFDVMNRAQNSKQQKIAEQQRKETEQREQVKKILPILGIVIVAIIVFCIIMASMSGGNSLHEPIQTEPDHYSFSSAQLSGIPPLFIIGRFDSRTKRQRKKDAEGCATMIFAPIGLIVTGLFTVWLWIFKAIFLFFTWPFKVLFKK